VALCRNGEQKLRAKLTRSHPGVLWTDMNGRRSISLHDNIAQPCTKWGECHFFSCLCQTLATFFSHFSFMTFRFVTFSFDVTLYDIVNDRRARVALKQIMLHFQSGTNWRSTLPLPHKKVLPSSTFIRFIQPLWDVRFRVFSHTARRYLFRQSTSTWLYIFSDGL